MKRTSMWVLLAMWLSGCTVVPVPVSSVIPGLVPQPQPRPMPTPTSYAFIAPNYATRATTAPTVMPLPAEPMQVVTPPAISPTPQVQNTATTQPIPTPTPVIVQAVNKQDLSWVAERVFMNEANNDPSKLISWNSKGNYATLGFGRFVWYPAGQRGAYPETFPAFLAFVESNRVPLPSWLAQRPTRGGPWANQAAFERAQNDQEMSEMRNFLNKTAHLQGSFMVGRLKSNLPNMVSNLPPSERQRVLKNFQVMEQTSGGLYPVLDYVYFKGDGTNPNEQYRGKGWGLVQVLQSMESVPPGAAALAEFMRAADDTLMRRIANAPIENGEARLLSAWQKRIQTYKPAAIAQAQARR